MAKHPPFFSNNNPKNRECGKLGFSTGFQQVFNNKLHKEIRQNDEHSTIQQVFNKVFKRQKAINKHSNVKKTSFQHFQHYYYYNYNKLIYKESEVSTGTR